MFLHRGLYVPPICTILAILLLFNTYDVHCDSTDSSSLTEEAAATGSLSTVTSQGSTPDVNDNPSTTQYNSAMVPSSATASIPTIETSPIATTGTISTVSSSIATTETSSISDSSTSVGETSSTTNTDLSTSSIEPSSITNTDLFTSVGETSSTTNTDLSTSSIEPSSTTNTDLSASSVETNSITSIDSTAFVVPTSAITNINSSYSDTSASSTTSTATTPTNDTTQAPATTNPPCYPNEFPFELGCIDPGTNGGVVITSFVLSIVTFAGTLGVTSYVLFFRKFFAPKKSRMMTAYDASPGNASKKQPTARRTRNPTRKPKPPAKVENLDQF